MCIKISSWEKGGQEDEARYSSMAVILRIYEEGGNSLGWLVL
jgi:hypothetical protein